MSRHFSARVSRFPGPASWAWQLMENPGSREFNNDQTDAVRSSGMNRASVLGIVLATLIFSGAVSVRAQSGESLVISEFMAANQETLIDEDGDASDWIELWNSGTEPVDLGGWFLTDDEGELELWPLPAMTLEPNAYPSWCLLRARTAACRSRNCTRIFSWTAKENFWR